MKTKTCSIVASGVIRSTEPERSEDSRWQLRFRVSLSRLAAAGVLFGLTSCAAATRKAGKEAAQKDETGVVYALGSREGFSSPLQKSLQTACPPLEFAGNHFDLSKANQATIKNLAESWKAAKPRYLIAGYAQSGLPEDYARSLSDRRAHGVRQALIEAGVEAANLQAVGFGHDIAPAGATANGVMVYRQ